MPDLWNDGRCKPLLENLQSALHHEGHKTVDLLFQTRVDATRNARPAGVAAGGIMKTDDWGTIWMTQSNFFRGVRGSGTMGKTIYSKRSRLKSVDLKL
jgi:hypothetical protein